MTSEFEVRCRRCHTPFEERENLLTGKKLWFPTCRHKVEDGEVVVLTDGRRP